MTSTRFAAALGRLWRASPPLTAVGLLMVPLAMASLAGMLLDPRLVAGAPAWLKPFKFAVSIGIYSLTLAWIFGRLTDWPRMRRVVGWTTAVVFVVELVIIHVQAWRGVGSHFNAATLLDGVLLTIMGIAIVTQTLVSVAVAVALWRQHFADRALGWALRLGMMLTIVGAFTGGLMTRPTAQQLADARAGKGMPMAGAHTVGAPDGGPGLPVTGWSRDHGDLRVPHFVGLHAVQVLALVGIGLRRRVRSEAVRVRGVMVAAASYGSLFVVLLWAALRGQSVIAADVATLTVLGAWAAATMLSTVSLLPGHLLPGRLRGPGARSTRQDAPGFRTRETGGSRYPSPALPRGSAQPCAGGLPRDSQIDFRRRDGSAIMRRFQRRPFDVEVNGELGPRARVRGD